LFLTTKMMNSTLSNEVIYDIASFQGTNIEELGSALLDALEKGYLDHMQCASYMTIREARPMAHIQKNIAQERTIFKGREQTELKERKQTALKKENKLR